MLFYICLMKRVCLGRHYLHEWLTLVIFNVLYDNNRFSGFCCSFLKTDVALLANEFCRLAQFQSPHFLSNPLQNSISLWKLLICHFCPTGTCFDWEQERHRDHLLNLKKRFVWYSDFTVCSVELITLQSGNKFILIGLIL